MHAALHQYKIRLTNLSQSNRSLKLARLSRTRDLDLTATAFVNGMSPKEILEKVVAGKSVNLIKELSANHEATNLLDRHLNSIYREARTIQEETGTYDLFVGYPFVEGKFLDGSVARCPLLLFPVRLVRQLSRRPRWRLEIPEGEPIEFNNTFFLAYEKFQQIRLERSFWEAEIEHARDLQELLNSVYAFFRSQELALHFESDLFRFDLTPFPDLNKEELNSLKVGRLRLLPHAVMGIFPQSDSALLQDYEELESKAGDFGLEQIFSPKSVALPQQEYISEDQRYFVTPLDQSQEEALLAVKNGNSIVLHGPPGTGKSQVIINLVADALAQGQRVLVCSQKRAALDVVYERLEQLGLGRFAALVHDYRSDRALIFNKIRRQIDDIPQFELESRDLGASKWERDFRLHARQIDSFNSFFDRLNEALTSDEAFGIAPHFLYQMLLEKEEVLPVREIALRFDADSLDHLIARIREVLNYREYLDAEFPWRWRLSLHQRGTAYREKMLHFLEALPGRCEALWGMIQRAGVNMKEALGETEDRWKTYMGLKNDLEQANFRQGWVDFYAQKLEVSFVRRKLDSLEKIFREMAQFKYLAGFQMTLFYDLEEHVLCYRDMHKKFGRLFSLPFLRARWFLNELLKDKEKKVSGSIFNEIWSEFSILQRLMKHAESLEGNFFFEDLPLTDSPGQLMSWAQEKRACLDMISSERKIRFWTSLKPFPDVASRSIAAAQWADFEARLGEIEHYISDRKQLEQEWKHWLHPHQIKIWENFLSEKGPVHELGTRWRSEFRQHFEELRQMDALLGEFRPLERQALDLIDDQLAKVEDPEYFLDVFRDNFIRAWIESIERIQPELLETSSRRMEGRRKEYRDRVRERQEKVIELILRKLKARIVGQQEFNRLGNPVTYREISHQVRKKRLLWSVRKMVREFWEESLGQLMPCWLASPESVAAIFPMQANFFDLVIFDEASQCYVERALPVMLRGRQCVIAGDDKQLPPFDLYRVRVDENEHEIEEVGLALEVESVLDLARSSFVEQHLLWHYRSVEEELINFSNHAFYQGQLKIIPPSVHQSQPPIDFVKVEGTWERNSNRKEAEKVVELVGNLIQSPDSPSIGIVTFNYHQKELIADLFEMQIAEANARQAMEDVEMWQRALSGTPEQPGLFVKNIENVQGDERDIIIFSVAYARNESGRLVTNFGLLNQRGGENRLNVAVTRARQRLIVVCSFLPSELSVDNAKHAGPRHFKQYLRYAQAVSRRNLPETERILAELAPLQEMPSRKGVLLDQNILKERLEKGLQSRGFTVVRDVGETAYKVDLAVQGMPGAYVLGIEVEGENYFRGRSAKEREVYRWEVLERRGWEVLRVWTRILGQGEAALEKLLNQIAKRIREKLEAD